MSTAAPVATKRPPRKPRRMTPQEIRKLIEERSPGLRLYNPSTEWVMIECHAIPRWFPPDLSLEDGRAPIEPHPTTGEPVRCDGVLEVRGRFLTQHDSSGKVISGQDAQSIVSFLISEDRGGQSGIVFLSGDPEEDKLAREYSREKFLEYQAQEDEKIIAARREFKNNWTKNPSKRGVNVPPPTQKEMDAIDRQGKRERKLVYRYECDVEDCPGYAQNDWSKFARHMAAAHNINVSREKYDGATGAVDPDSIVSVDKGAVAPADAMTYLQGGLAEAAERMGDLKPTDDEVAAARALLARAGVDEPKTVKKAAKRGKRPRRS